MSVPRSFAEILEGFRVDRPSAVDEAHRALTPMATYVPCGRLTKTTGKPCTLGRVRGIPACAQHATADEKSENRTRCERARQVIAEWEQQDTGEPACWSWSVTSDDRAVVAMTDESRASSALRRWQRDRCALCGYVDHLVLDHDHASGLIRGWLCVGCNIHEPHDVGSKFTDYRARPPAVMLGMTARYFHPIFGWAATTSCRLTGVEALDSDPSYRVAAAIAAAQPSVEVSRAHRPAAPSSRAREMMTP